MNKHKGLLGYILLELYQGTAKNSVGKYFGTRITFLVVCQLRPQTRDPEALNQKPKAPK